MLCLTLIMRFFSDIGLGFSAFFEAIRFIKEQRYYYFMVFPALLMLVIYWVGAQILAHEIEVEVSNMNEITWMLFYLLIEISLAVLMMKFAKYLVIAMLSPLISSISRKTEKKLSGKTYDFSWRQLMHDLKRAYRIILRNLMWEYTFFLIIFLVSYFGWEEPRKSPVFYLTFVIGFFYYGFGFLDYILERLKLDLDESVRFVRRHRGLAITIGCIYSLMILVPVDLGRLFNWSTFGEAPLEFIGYFILHLALWILASAAPIVAIVTATISMHKLVNFKSPKEEINSFLAS